MIKLCRLQKDETAERVIENGRGATKGKVEVNVHHHGDLDSHFPVATGNRHRLGYQRMNES